MNVMQLDEKYKYAFCEALYVIKNLNEDNKSKISPNFIDFLEENQIQNYTVDLPTDVIRHPEQLRKETRTLLALIYRDFFCTESEKEDLQKIWYENSQKSNEKVVGDSKLVVPSKEDNPISNNEERKAIIEYKKEVWYTKILKSIKKILHIR